MWSYRTPSKSRAERVKKAKVIRWESLDVYWVGRWVLRQRSQYLMCWALLKIERSEADIAFNSESTATFCPWGGEKRALSISVKQNPLMPHAPPDLRGKISLRKRRFVISLSSASSTLHRISIQHGHYFCIHYSPLCLCFTIGHRLLSPNLPVDYLRAKPSFHPGRSHGPRISPFLLEANIAMLYLRVANSSTIFFF